MIECSVCKTQNHHLAINCSSCGGYLQQKIETLDLFNISWMLIEHPGKAFHRISIATHKNYIIFLSGLGGIGLLFSGFWFFKIGDIIPSLLRFLGIGIGAGILFGEIFVLLLSFLIWIILRIEKKSVAFRQAFVTTAYSLIPVIISVILLLPIEVLTFGTNFFGTNPSPYILKPFSYVVLLILDSLFGLWSIILLWIGIFKLRGTGWMRALAIELVVLAITLSILHYLMLVVVQI
jgi:hypothetical protein